MVVAVKVVEAVVVTEAKVVGVVANAVVEQAVVVAVHLLPSPQSDLNRII